VQIADVELLLRVHGLTLHHKVCEAVKFELAVHIEPHPRTETSELRWLDHVTRMPQESLSRRVPIVQGKRPRPPIRTRRRDYIFELAWSRQGCGAGAKNLYVVELEPEIGVPLPQSYVCGAS